MADPLIDDVREDEGAAGVSDSGPVLSRSPARQSAAADMDRTQRVQAACLVILAVAAVLSLLYVAKLILIVVLTAILLSFVLAPVVDALVDLRIPRPMGTLLAVLALVGTLAGLSYFSYARAVDFMSQVPEYRTRVRRIVDDIRNRAEQFEKSTETVLPAEPEEPGSVIIRQRNGLGNIISENVGTVSGLFLAISFIPFLTFFMLSWRDHVRASTVMLFDMKNRNTAFVALGQIAAMIRSFIVGNLMIGLFLSAASTAAFGLMSLPYFYFLGVISGFLSLIPYLGVVLAILPPVIVGIGYLTTATFALTCAAVVGLHLFAMNVLYPMVLGKRLQLNPLAVTLSLLFWGWLWGAMGLVLAVPITGALKIVCDNIDRLRPFGAWMGE
jgi:predicted PurR-regulated permease PerM